MLVWKNKLIGICHDYEKISHSGNLHVKYLSAFQRRIFIERAQNEDIGVNSAMWA